MLTYGVITTTANELVSDVHNRMPVIVPPESYAEWLDLKPPERRLSELLVTYPASEMRVTAVGPAVNSPKNDGLECLEAA